MLSKKAISDYQAIFLKEYGYEISEEEANRQGTKLLRLFRLIYRPVPIEYVKENYPELLKTKQMKVTKGGEKL